MGTFGGKRVCICLGCELTLEFGFRCPSPTRRARRIVGGNRRTITCERT